jgi:3-deoxy-D-manno-octulosonic-acid transferase
LSEPVGLGLQAYRAVTTLLDPLTGPLGRVGGEAWRAGFRGSSPETERAAGSVWIHAASIGEVGAAGPWVRALLDGGYRPPLLFTTRTRPGLDRARSALGEAVAARIAPHDLPGLVGDFLNAACPWRLDLIETELWPNLLLEARHRSIPVLFVGGTVSERSARLLGDFGVAGPHLLGEGVFALPQTERHAERFQSLGVPPERIRVIGDLKADVHAEPGRQRAPFRLRPALVFGSLRPGEERVARTLADAIEGYLVGYGRERLQWAERAGVNDPFQGRSRALLVVAPRHRKGEQRIRAAFRGSGFQLLVRDEASRRGSGIAEWIDRAASHAGLRVALLATKGELPAAYESAWGAVVGGTFAPYGGHNVWEPAAADCPVIVGPHHGEVSTAVEALLREGAAIVATDGGEHLKRIVEAWLRNEELEEWARSAARAVSRAVGAASRGMDAIGEWGLMP